MRSQWSFFCQQHRSRTSYHSWTDCLEYRINLVKIVLVDFQQRKNIAINDPLEPQNVLILSAYIWYAKWEIFCVVFFCNGNRVNNKYKNDEQSKIIFVIVAI